MALNMVARLMNGRSVDLEEGETIGSINVEVAGKMGDLPTAGQAKANGRPRPR